MQIINIIEFEIKAVLTKYFSNNMYMLKKMQVYLNNLQSLFYKNILILDIFDYKSLIKKRNVFLREAYFLNSYYGSCQNIKKYSNYENPIYACMEHGLITGNIVLPFETYKSGLPGIITLSKNRMNHIRKVTNKPVLDIGPYIHYAPYLLSNIEKEDLKEKLGKVLLVFPMHSIETTRADYNVENFIQFILDFKNKYSFNSVLVCMYWKNIESKEYVPFKKNNFHIVTAGHRNDPYFLSRLKSIIDIADYTITNCIGTHVGYCVYLNKPHYVFRQKVQLHYLSKTSYDLHNTAQTSDFGQKKREEEVEEIYNVFKDIEFHVTKKQYNICNKYWGFDSIKTKEEIHDYLKKCYDIFKKSKKKSEEEYNKHYKDFFEIIK